jgi:hypothetical protein
MTRSRAIRRLARNMSKRHDNPGPIENTGEEKSPEWALDDFKYPEMTGHNRSIDWIVDVSNTLGADIRTEVDGGYSHCSESFEIMIRGRESGILYRISVTQSNKQLEIMSKRVSEFTMTSRESAVILYAFRDLMEIRVSWWDICTSRWEYICMRDELNELSPHWPGDGVVSMLYLLHNDLEQSTELSLKTLRREMRKALVIYWFNGMTNPLMTMNEVMDFSEGLRELENAESKIGFLEARKRMLDSLERLRANPDALGNKEGVIE